jgi:hypothetical protein
MSIYSNSGIENDFLLRRIYLGNHLKSRTYCSVAIESERSVDEDQVFEVVISIILLRVCKWHSLASFNDYGDLEKVFRIWHEKSFHYFDV